MNPSCFPGYSCGFLYVKEVFYTVKYSRSHIDIMIGPGVELEKGSKLALLKEGAYYLMQVKEKLGSGAQGTVYEALIAEIDTTKVPAVVKSTNQYAIKQIKVSLDAFELEQKIARSISDLKNFNSRDKGSAHICKLFGVIIPANAELDPPSTGDFLVYKSKNVKDARTFLIYEFIEGSTLTEYMKSKPSIEERLRLGEELIKACAEFHSDGIAHTDIKADNIMIGKDKRLRLIDYGQSCKIAECTGGGTPEYWAPDTFIFQTAPPSPHLYPLVFNPLERDIYALGCVLFELVAEKPFQSLAWVNGKDKTALKEVLKHLGDQPKPVGDEESIWYVNGFSKVPFTWEVKRSSTTLVPADLANFKTIIEALLNFDSALFTHMEDIDKLFKEEERICESHKNKEQDLLNDSDTDNDTDKENIPTLRNEVQNLSDACAILKDRRQVILSNIETGPPHTSISGIYPEKDKMVAILKKSGVDFSLVESADAAGVSEVMAPIRLDKRSFGHLRPTAQEALVLWRRALDAKYVPASLPAPVATDASATTPASEPAEGPVSMLGGYIRNRVRRITRRSRKNKIRTKHRSPVGKRLTRRAVLR